MSDRLTEHLSARIRTMQRGQRAMWVFITMLIVSLLVVAILQTADAADAKRKRGALVDDVAALSSSQAEFEARLDEANDRLREAGEPTVTVPDTPPAAGPKGDTGPVGPGPSSAQVAQAVRAYCVDINGCAGRDGADVTPAQVAEAVSRYCDDRGQCAGPQGDSVKGDQGDTGLQGPPPSDEQVQAAVEAYCAAHGDCLGKDGEDGSDGEDGAPGPACPEGYTGTEAIVVTDTGPRDVFLCTANSNGG